VFLCLLIAAYWKLLITGKISDLCEYNWTNVSFCYESNYSHSNMLLPPTGMFPEDISSQRLRNFE
jgi:hypothetical protein